MEWPLVFSKSVIGWWSRKRQNWSAGRPDSSIYYDALPLSLVFVVKVVSFATLFVSGISGHWWFVEGVSAYNSGLGCIYTKSRAAREKKRGRVVQRRGRGRLRGSHITNITGTTVRRRVVQFAVLTFVWTADRCGKQLQRDAGCNGQKAEPTSIRPQGVSRTTNGKHACPVSERNL